MSAMLHSDRNAERALISCSEGSIKRKHPRNFMSSVLMNSQDATTKLQAH